MVEMTMMMMIIDINDCDDHCEQTDDDDVQQFQKVMIERDLNDSPWRY